jgi:hypothetical protein
MDNKNIEKELLEMGFTAHNIKDIMKVVKKKNNNNTGIGCRGHVQIEKIYVDGTREVVESSDNLIVNGGLTAISQIFGNAASPNNYANKRPSYIAVGTDNTAEANGQTTLENEVFSDVINSTTFPDFKSVRFEMIILEDEAVGETLRETGLFSADDTMISRKTFEPIAKNDSFQLAIQWTFIFDRA